MKMRMQGLKAQGQDFCGITMATLYAFLYSSYFEIVSYMYFII